VLSARASSECQRPAGGFFQKSRTLQPRKKPGEIRVVSQTAGFSTSGCSRQMPRRLPIHVRTQRGRAIHQPAVAKTRLMRAMRGTVSEPANYFSIASKRLTIGTPRTTSAFKSTDRGSEHSCRAQSSNDCVRCSVWFARLHNAHRRCSGGRSHRGATPPKVPSRASARRRKPGR
jgi:hypothetical protein